jgi:hypothetical protein
MSTLFVNNLNTASGSTITVPTGKKVIVTDEGGLVMPGTVIQTANNQTTSQGGAVTTTSTSYVTSGITVALTAKQTGSKFRIQFVAPMSHPHSDAINVMIHETAAGRGARGSTYSFGYGLHSQNTYQPIIIDYLETLTNTAGTNYSYDIYYKSSGGGGVQLIHNTSGFYFNMYEIAQ